MPKVALHSLGCRLNYAELNEIADQFLAHGFEVVNFDEPADLYIINGCAVTASAEKKTRQTLHSATRRGQVLITGCSHNPDINEQAYYEPNKQQVLPTALKILNYKPEYKTSYQIYNNHTDRTRAFIKIQDSCNRFCTYCIIPHLRGPVRSIPYAHILKRIQAKQAEGYQEIILTGVNIHLYNYEGMTIETLFARLLTDTTIPRFRLGSLDPFLMTDRFIETFTNPRFLPHIHLSLQSGSDALLKRMNRRYTAMQFKEIVAKFRNINPNFGITTDIIIGFPGETETDFIATKDLMESLKFSKSHIFPYSPRAGTAAFRFKDNVPHNIKKSRAKTLRDLDQQLQIEFAKAQVDTIQPVLFEHKKDNYWHGYTPNYVKIQYQSNQDLTNQIINVAITAEMIN